MSWVEKTLELKQGEAANVVRLRAWNILEKRPKRKSVQRPSATRDQPRIRE
jgi:hypothetical protein